MGKRRTKTIALGVLMGVLAFTTFAVAYVDFLLLQLYQRQRADARLSAGATPLPVLQPTPPPVIPTDTPKPTRAPLPGDIENVPFPNYDTGAGADYSYQSDELRVAVNKVEEEGVTYFVADIWMRNINCFRTAFSSGKYRGKREPAEKIARDNNAVLAVNGDFLGGLVIRNGVLYRKANLRATPEPDPAALLEETPARPERSTCVLYFDGRMATAEYDRFRSATAMENGAWQGWQFGPTLIREGKAAKDVKTQGRNPRCILGYYQPGHYALILIDGRRKNYSIGMNFKEMINLCEGLGLTEAYNLDGGGSAVMVFNGETINRPSGKAEGRNLPDMIVIGDYLEPGLLFSPTPSPAASPTPSPTFPAEGGEQ